MTEPVVDPRYVAARRILLDALEALAPHGAAFIVVGAQAIYLHTGAAELDRTVAPYTTDGDLIVNPSLLGDDPLLETAMRGAHMWNAWQADADGCRRRLGCPPHRGP